MRVFIITLCILIMLASTSMIIARYLNQSCLTLNSIEFDDDAVSCRRTGENHHNSDGDDDDDGESMVVFDSYDNRNNLPRIYTWTDHTVSTKPFCGATIVKSNNAHVQSLRVWLPRNISATEVFTFTLFLHRRDNAPVRISPILTWDSSIDGNNVIFGLGANTKLRIDDVISVSRTYTNDQYHSPRETGISPTISSHPPTTTTATATATTLATTPATTTTTNTVPSNPGRDGIMMQLTIL
jgi:hypothetical protein